VSSHEVLLHLRTLKPELDDVEKAHQLKFERARLIKEDPTLRGKLVESEHEKKFIDREQLFGLKAVVDTVRGADCDGLRKRRVRRLTPLLGLLVLLKGIVHFGEAELTTSRQSTDGNQQLSRDLQQLNKFTKIEVLQIIDLSPRTPVELYTVRSDPSPFQLAAWRDFFAARQSHELMLTLPLLCLARSSKSSLTG
jgi:hypothetical protein